jgi:cysteine-S-conjugate beta-lyase
MTQTIPFDLDQQINRRGTGCAKWSVFGEDVLPLWVADMDFQAPPAVLDALRERVDHGIFGYTFPPQRLASIIVGRMARLYNWHIQPEDIVYIPGVVPGINLTARATAQDGAVLIQTPVYPPFHYTSRWSGTDLQQAPLSYLETSAGFTYGIDFEAFEAAITPQTKMFLLCNPHNPVGRMFTEDELTRMAEICQRHDITICSDEIHSDLVLDGTQHIPIANLSEDAAQRTVTLIAPSKTYNIPGLLFSVAIIQNPDLRRRFMEAGAGILIMLTDQYAHSMVNMMGATAAEAAYQHGDEWLRSVLDYVQSNRDFAVAYLREYMPALKTAQLEGTYLLWIDCRGANLPEEPGKWFVDNARVALNEGSLFGDDGKGFVRMNLACPRSTLKDALEQMKDALSHRDS